MISDSSTFLPISRYSGASAVRLPDTLFATMAHTDDVTQEDITPDGDIILIVGQDPKTKLRVSSACLVASSPVFAAMLGPRFREGQATGTVEKRKEIVLRDDVGYSNFRHVQPLAPEDAPAIAHEATVIDNPGSCRRH